MWTTKILIIQSRNDTVHKAAYLQKAGCKAVQSFRAEARMQDEERDSPASAGKHRSGILLVKVYTAS